MCNEIEGSYDKIIITIAPSYTEKNITRLLPLALLLVLHTHNNTDSNKLMTFSGIALYYGDNYIVILCVDYYSFMWYSTAHSGSPQDAFYTNFAHKYVPVTLRGGSMG